MKYNSDFRHDLEVGQGAENLLGQLLESKKLEVKMDRRARQNGLFFIEYESRGKPSGISTTEAAYWALVIEGASAVIVRTEKLKDLARATLQINGYIRGGDSNTSKGVLVKLEDLLK